MKALSAVVLVLSSLGAPAQALEASTAYCADDFFWWTIEQSMISAQIVAPTIEKLGEAVDVAHDVTIAGPKDAANVPVRAIQPSDETRTVEYATGKGNKLTVDDTIGPNTIPAQIVATEPAIEKLGESVEEAHDVTITGPKDAANVPVGAIQPSDETRTVEYATGKGNKLTVHDTVGPNTIPAQIVATEPAIEKLGEAVDEAHDVTITGPNAANVSVSAIQPSDETRTAEEAKGNKSTVDATIEQSTMAAPILTTEPAIKKLSGATPQVDGITMTAPNDAQDVPVGAIQPSNKTPNVASSIRHDDKLRLDAPIEQSTMSAQTIAPTPAIERLNQAHGVAITVPNNAGDLPVRGDSPQQQNSERGVLNLE